MKGLVQVSPNIIGSFDPIAAHQELIVGSDNEESPADIGVNFQPAYKDHVSNPTYKTSASNKPTLDPSSALWHFDPSLRAFGGASVNPTEFLEGRFPEGMTLQKLQEAGDNRPEVLDRYVNTCVALGHLSIVTPEPGDFYEIRTAQAHRFNQNGDPGDRVYIYGGLEGLD